MSLFSSEIPRESQIVPLKDAVVTYTPHFYSEQEAVQLYKTLLTEINWQQDKITLFGKTHLQPRLTALYGDEEIPYSYSGIVMTPRKFSRTLHHIKTAIENHTGATFNTVLCNLYRDGKDSNGWHSDNEKELGPDPIIVSISLGETRMFHLKNKQAPTERIKLALTNGSLLYMGKGTQKNYKHQLAKTQKQITPRINLTFRRLY
ncbi:2OG-Fe(II) oxygenase [unidentified eubacterium SCB49]|nr:2OG-Fe(II) oxygenase [unidentified eubacterium SCB49]